MSEMIERVARALCANAGEPEYCVKFYISSARAAIEAMREPTEAMIEKGREETCEHGDMQCGADESWRAMIDEALK